MSQLELLKDLPGKRILVVGDVMLDIYKVATATRISPEAPVPVLLNPQTEYRLGGAGAVAAMCRALGAQVDLVACVGLDRAGERVRNIVEATGIGCKLFSLPAPRPTTTKERICGVASGRHRQQLARVDTECTDDFGPATYSAIADLIDSLDPPDAIIIADYAKGVCDRHVVRACKGLARTYVDPPKNADWSKYNCVECIVPNREEAAGRTARELCCELQSRAAVVKLDEAGCEVSFMSKTLRIPARARAVHDVTGAGDQFAAVLTCAQAVGLDWPAATHLANAAAGLQVERHGCVPVTLDELMTEIHHASAHPHDAGHRDRTGEAVAAGRP